MVRADVFILNIYFVTFIKSLCISTDLLFEKTNLTETSNSLDLFQQSNLKQVLEKHKYFIKISTPKQYN